jgi:hypothetical protein
MKPDQAHNEDAHPSQVADLADPFSVQPRIPVKEKVAEVLGTSGRNDAEVIVGFTYRALAARVYETEQPTPAKLVAEGRAERGEERNPSSSGSWLTWLVDLPVRTHERRGKYGVTWQYANPGGVCIKRTPTEEDIAAREAWAKGEGGQRIAAIERTFGQLR